LSPSAALQRARDDSAFDERQQIFVDDLRVSGAHPVGIALLNLQRSVFDKLDGKLGGVGDGDDLIVMAMKDQYPLSAKRESRTEDAGFRKGC
jgi:hypothetical protein